jgi:hypothetical protein
MWYLDRGFRFHPQCQRFGYCEREVPRLRCGDGAAKDLPITITSLAANGSGTANLSCGSGCGFNFSIQVAPDRSTLNLVDVSDPGNYLEGTAIHQ